MHVEGLDALPARMAKRGVRVGRTLVVTDETVGALYLDRVVSLIRTGGGHVEAHVLPPGEATKSPAHLAALYDWALGLGIDRQTPVVALGGGVVGDLAGFAAATLLRGLPLVHVPTSLIAQVDSAIGGKTGINHTVGKNLVGAFHQPAVVLADPSVLRTLAPRDLRSGLAEAVKHALIADAAFADALAASWDALVAAEVDALGPMVHRAASIKAQIVSADVREQGERALLNFGHTFGHALEREAGYGTLTHGEAVAIGMRAALHLSASLRAGRDAGGALPAPFRSAAALVDRIDPPAVDPALSVRQLTEAMASDKKRDAGGLRFVVLDAVGRARIAEGVPRPLVEAAWAFALRR